MTSKGIKDTAFISNEHLPIEAKELPTAYLDPKSTAAQMRNSRTYVPDERPYLMRNIDLEEIRKGLQ